MTPDKPPRITADDEEAKLNEPPHELTKHKPDKSFNE